MSSLNSRKNIKDCCRTCLSDLTNKIYDLFDKKDDSPSLAEILSLFTNILIQSEDMALPKHLCSSCFNCLINFYNFKKLAEKVDLHLHQYYQNFISTETTYHDSKEVVKNEFIESDDEPLSRTLIARTKPDESIYQNESVSKEIKNEDSVESIEDCSFNNILELSYSDYNLQRKSMKKTKHTLNNKTYLCSHCPMIFKVKQKYENHLPIHKEENSDTDSVKCDICSATFKNTYALAAHKRIHVPRGRILSCQYCNKVFKKTSHLKRHEGSHDVNSDYNLQRKSMKKTKHTLNNKTYLCSHCPMIFKVKQKYENHLPIHKEENSDTDSVKCDICSATFKTTYALAAHKRIHVPRGRILSCQYCNKVFKKTSHLKRHEGSHDVNSDYNLQRKSMKKTKHTLNNKTYLCSHCPMIFKVKQKYENHLPIHKEENSDTDSVKCDICSATFKTTYALAAHKRIHVPRGRILSCQYCNKVFKKTSHLKRHEGSHDVNRKYKCSLCPKAYHLESSLLEHMHKHNGIKPHPCPICPKAFAHLSSLNNHLKLHTRGKAYLCPTCGKVFNSNTNLTQHVRRHLGLKQFACTLCPGKFVSKGELLSHVKRHTGEKSYKCKQCMAAFTAPHSLKKHMLKHLGVKPHQCDTCPMKFTTKEYLRTHYRIHTGEKPYRCDLCERAFTQSGDLLKHKRVHLGVNLYKCDQCSQSFRLKSQLRDHISDHYVSAMKAQQSNGNTIAEDKIS